jgi:hypothetical protein
MAGHPAGTAPLFSGLTGLSLAAAGPSPTARPFFPLSILQFNATDITGLPVGSAFAFLLNTDSFMKAFDAIPLVNGIARVAVPAGNYSVLGLFRDFDANGNVTAARTVVLADLSVAPSGTTTALLDERTATLHATVTTPRPANQDTEVTTLDRSDAAGKSFSISDISSGSTSTFVNAQPPAKVGILRYVVEWGGRPTTEPSAPYRFDVAFGIDGIPADQSFVVKPTEIATVHQHFSADPAGQGGSPAQRRGGPTQPIRRCVGSADRVQPTIGRSC